MHTAPCPAAEDVEPLPDCCEPVALARRWQAAAAAAARGVAQPGPGEVCGVEAEEVAQ